MWRLRLRVDDESQEAMANFEALFGALNDDVLPPKLQAVGAVTRDELQVMRDQLAEEHWSGAVATGKVAVRWLHTDARWRGQADGPPDEFAGLEQRGALIDALDVLIASLREGEALELSELVDGD